MTHSWDSFKRIQAEVGFSLISDPEEKVDLSGKSPTPIPCRIFPIFLSSRIIFGSIFKLIFFIQQSSSFDPGLYVVTTQPLLCTIVFGRNI